MTQSATRDRNSPPVPRNAPLSLTVNGDRMTVAADSSLGDFLRARELDPRLVVVEHNRVILRDREAYQHIRLNDGDVLEIVHFVGGG